MKNYHKSLYQYSSVILEATGTEKLQGKQYLKCLKNSLFKKNKIVKNNKKCKVNCFLEFQIYI